MSPKTIFAVRGSHLPTLPKAKTKVRGSQFAPSLIPLPLHKSSRFAVRTFSLSTALTQKFAVRSSHLLFLSTALTKSSRFAVRTFFFFPLPYLKVRSSQFAPLSISLLFPILKVRSSRFAPNLSLICPNSKVRSSLFAAHTYQIFSALTQVCGSQLAATHFPDNPTPISLQFAVCTCPFI